MLENLEIDAIKAEAINEMDKTLRKNKLAETISQLGFDPNLFQSKCDSKSESFTRSSGKKAKVDSQIVRSNSEIEKVKNKTSLCMMFADDELDGIIGAIDTNSFKL